MTGEKRNKSYRFFRLSSEMSEEARRTATRKNDEAQAFRIAAISFWIGTVERHILGPHAVTHQGDATLRP